MEIMRMDPSYPEFEEWYKKVVMLMNKIHQLEEDDLIFDFFWQAFEGAGMTPRQAVEAYTDTYL